MARSRGLGKGGSNGRLVIGKDWFNQIMSAYGFPNVFTETIRSNNGLLS